MTNGKMWIIGAFISVAVSSSFANADAESSVVNAYKVCSVLNGAGFLSKPCEVSGWSNAVDISTDANSTEARKICTGVSGMMMQKGIRFDRGWKIRIYSPFSNGNTVATCSLPN